VRAQGVVELDEAVDLTLENPQAPRRALAGQEDLERLVETLDLAAGLRRVGPGVLVDDAEALELGLKDGLALPRPGVVDGTIVREHRGRERRNWLFTHARLAEPSVIDDEGERSA